VDVDVAEKTSGVTVFERMYDNTVPFAGVSPPNVTTSGLIGIDTVTDREFSFVLVAVNV